MSDQPIRALYGVEPMRENEYPAGFTVGHQSGGKTVDRITYREHNYGDHGIGWYDVYAGEHCIASMNVRAVAEVHYFVEQPA